ncbi:MULTISPECIES: adenine deaminase [Roseivirga]|mgnify:CR=1 FL=1|uniref:Adenine deaminase n=1 Tax=Roseivirga spongicola TaxID=333140 RepID=A0A150X1L8_9BACT|nr:MULTISPECIES: adenine deaminase [Roseivirga]KYG72586.1 adenosine deaminase [Roseivirga spongicola]MBO6659419.1 adenine deaminase [Roseivirga sp.]MBO6907844.1 adenine deaminase [Roseivirga sp.]WPZ10181.1 adenine deaminase [Roseivirga spongicola]
MKISGHIVDVRNRRMFDGEITVQNDRIISIEETEKVDDQYILPGFIDSHVHVESSMLVPSEFARLAVVHGTVSTVSDPHEIGNVLGVEGVEYMIENGKKANFKFNFGAPSCVPATTFETAGAEITPEEVEYLLKKPEVKYLAEMMNWPGVLFKDETVYKKLNIAKELGKPIDGHAPGLRGEQAEQYIKAGMSTDHECFTADEARDKLKHGMKIAIREGSAAKNFEALVELFAEAPEMLMFCSDDKHPDNLVEGHVDQLVKRALAKGHDLFDVLTAACVTPIDHYKLDVGSLQKGDFADFIVVNNLKDFKVSHTYINGIHVADNGKTLIERVENDIINQFNCNPISLTDIQVRAESSSVHVIEALDGQLITNCLEYPTKTDSEGNAISDIENDVLKMVVVNRYNPAPPAIAFIKNFNLKEGAIASSVGHDSHNIIAVGADDESIVKAVNLVIEASGGVSAVSPTSEMVLPLPVAGIMSAENGYEVAKKYTLIDKMSKSLGSTLNSPFMTLSFMALLVIPKLKLSDLGLFDGEKFEFKSLFKK